MNPLLFARPDENRWTDSAVCATVDPELFFPERGHSSLPAKRICATCPVRLDCLTEGLGEEEGIWGGLNPDERMTLNVTIARNPARRAALILEATQTIHPSTSTHLNRRNTSWHSPASPSSAT